MTNELNKEQLNKVAGGEVTFGDANIVKCDSCKGEYDLDLATSGAGIIVGSLQDGSSSSYRPTCICPCCSGDFPYTYIQRKLNIASNHAKVQ